MRDEQLKSFKTGGKRNEDYYAYRKEALAPADGVVATVVDGIPENPAPLVDEGDKPVERAWTSTGNRVAAVEPQK